MKRQVSKIINEARKQGRTVLTEIESKQLLKEVGINTTEIKLAASQQRGGQEHDNSHYFHDFSPDLLARNRRTGCEEQVPCRNGDLAARMGPQAPWGAGTDARAR